jgi:glycosyltransferase involved in cell wall biosynthesis
MHILIVNNTSIPVHKYGGTERVIWWLGKALVQDGHQVSYLVAPGSSCEFANVYTYNESVPFNTLIPEGIDVVHLNHHVNEIPNIPYIQTMHGNLNHTMELDQNTVFVSKNHAARFGSDSYVHNGIDPMDYGMPILKNEAVKNYFHFLGDAAWRVKNVKGAIQITKLAHQKLRVVGGVRFNFNQGIRLSFDTHVRFDGMQGGKEKNEIIKYSKGLIFPVRWHEPFGLALIESLYFGCPVFGTPYGSLPEIVVPEVGYLTTTASGLADAVACVNDFNRKHCHEYVMDNFTHIQMSASYVRLYEKVLNGEKLNPKAPIIQTIQHDKFLPFN